jgi:hypothetical protein
MVIAEGRSENSGVNPPRPVQDGGRFEAPRPDVTFTQPSLTTAYRWDSAESRRWLGS